MKIRLFFLSVIIALTTFLYNNVSAQIPDVDSLLKRALETNELLPMLMDSAIKNSALMRKWTGSIEFADQNLQINKKNIYNSLSLLSSYNYGTNYSAINNPSGSSLNNFTTSQNGFYNLGIGLQLPLSNIINRKNLIRSGEAQIKIATGERDNVELFIRQEVIRLYQELKLSQRLLLVAGKNKESLQINYTMSEKEYIQGQATIDQLSRTLDIYNRTVVEYETYLNRFQTAYMELEAFTGTSLSSLIKQMK